MLNIYSIMEQILDLPEPEVNGLQNQCAAVNNGCSYANECTSSLCILQSMSENLQNLSPPSFLSSFVNKRSTRKYSNLPLLQVIGSVALTCRQAELIVVV